MSDRREFVETVETVQGIISDVANRAWSVHIDALHKIAFEQTFVRSANTLYSHTSTLDEVIESVVRVDMSEWLGVLKNALAGLFGLYIEIQKRPTMQQLRYSPLIEGVAHILDVRQNGVGLWYRLKMRIVKSTRSWALDSPIKPSEYSRLPDQRIKSTVIASLRTLATVIEMGMEIKPSLVREALPSPDDICRLADSNDW